MPHGCPGGPRSYTRGASRYREGIEKLERRITRLEGADVVPLLNLVRTLRDQAEGLELSAQRRSEGYQARRLAGILAGRIR
jgi:hypothetical protein